MGSIFNLSNRRKCDGVGGPARAKRSVKDGTAEVLDEPKLGIVLSDTLELADAALLGSAVGNSVTGTLEHDGEIHAENTSGGVILNSEINMLIDTKSEVAYGI